MDSMRVATSTIYDNQIASIDNLVAQQQQLGNEASTGIALNAPSDDPSQIAQDLQLRTTIAQETQAGTNIQSASAQLTTVDGALSTLTSIMQSARSIAVQAGSGLGSTTSNAALADQVDSLLNEAIGLANTKYAGKYVFSGSSGSADPPVSADGEPANSVTITGNEGGQKELLYGGVSVNTGITLQQAFNVSAANGSPSIFQTLINLRNTLSSGSITSESSTGVNTPGTAFVAGVAPPAQPIDAGPPLSPQILSTKLAPDSNGNVAFAISSQQDPSGVTITIPATATVDQAVALINAQTATTGITAKFDYQQQRLSLTSKSGAFQLTDVPSAGATNSGNFIEAFGLQSNADLTNDASRQLGDIDNATQALLGTRAALGGTIQSLTAMGSASSSQVVNDTQVQSGIEDADIAKVISEFSQTQTALQAAYGTTTRLESKTLFDYLQ